MVQPTEVPGGLAPGAPEIETIENPIRRSNNFDALEAFPRNRVMPWPYTRAAQQGGWSTKEVWGVAPEGKSEPGGAECDWRNEDPGCCCCGCCGMKLLIYQDATAAS